MGSTRRWSPVLAMLVAAFVVGCGSSGNQYNLVVGADDGGPGFFGDASAPGALDAYIEQGHVSVKIITLTCSGDCATVQAVGTGGYPPYTFRWDDGSTTPVRQVCPSANASYFVKVSDTGSSGELARPPQSEQVPLTANVLACPDASMTTAACDSSARVPKAGTYAGPYTSQDLGGLQTGTLTLTLMNLSGALLSGSFAADLAGLLHNTGSFTGGVDCSTGTITVRGTSSDGKLYVYTMTYDPSTETLKGTWSYTCAPGVNCTGEPDGGGDSGTLAVTLVDSGS
jgi:hypothetical protein